LASSFWISFCVCAQAGLAIAAVSKTSATISRTVIMILMLVSPYCIGTGLNVTKTTLVISI
jgi:hypothetical protein